ncbi:hypothetical protein GYMLUDRAFT_157196 [Collybiopsis luxurians FD-317 M1]|nr:hypothetical protein GYMLUDRAFT_157196 [Collybiopsis luxurians FD-317 M1]
MTPAPSAEPGPVTKPAQTPKKGGSKAKGSVRAKSGCYTCRIRRKKCDERPDAEGRCETCLRLRLQCLGFGAKRPEWLRENNNVNDLRDKIKTFLASQGMIKGHSGSGPRAPEQEPPTLHLASQNYNSPTESPPSQLLVLSDEAVRHGPVSNVREEWSPYPGGPPPPGYEAHPGPHPGPPPQSEWFLTHSWSPTDAFPSFSQVLHVQARQVVPALPPTMASSFGHLYTAILEDADTSTYYVNGSVPSPLAPNGMLDELSIHYINTVAGLQYQLADKSHLPRILFEDLQNHDGFARRAARLLASVHVQRSAGSIPRSIELTPVKEGYKELLSMFSFAKQQFDADDALAALNVISTFLFDGGRGDWERWLRVASSYSTRILSDRNRFMDYRDAITNCEDKERFIIMTTFWFDVLASVTTMESPIFVDAIDELYNPSKQSGLMDVSDDSADALSMLPIMGCENRIVWAISQISSLYVWKQSREKEGRLSILELSRRANDIEAYLAPPDPSLEPRTEEDVPRLLASEAFRTSAVVYLRTVVHGDHPLVPEIAEAVNEAILSLEQIASAPERPRHVAVRSTVFPFFISAALTMKPVKRNSLLNTLIGEGEVGNCRGVVELLKGLNPGTAKAKAVPWRAAIRSSRMLLV